MCAICEIVGTTTGHWPSAAANRENPEVASTTIDFGAPARRAGIDVDIDADELPAGSLQTLANYLRIGYWQDTDRTERWFDMAANEGVLLYNVSGFSGDSNGLSSAGREMVREAFRLYEAVLGIDFQETTSTGGDVDFFFRNTSSGSSHSGTMEGGDGGPINFATINLSESGSVGSRALQSALHEIGHGLGLGHQGTYNGDGDTDIPFWSNDSWQLSMMSYLDQEEGVSVNADFAYLLSPMSADWLALNDNYGWQGYGVNNAFKGDTTWGFNTNISSTVSAAYAGLAGFADTNAFCIVDGSGIDTLDFSGYSATQTIDLTEASSASIWGSVSSVGGLIGNMTIAVGTIIENAIGGLGRDKITGNKAGNIVNGGAGNDLLNGVAGDDTIKGGNGKDQICGGAGRDVFDYDFASESRPGSLNFDEVRSGGGGNAFEGAGDAAGDIFDFTDLGDLNWGGTDRGSIYLKDVSSVTHCYVNIDSDAPAELDVAILDGAVRAGAYTAADFNFL
jgi:hypothetical protein